MKPKIAVTAFLLVFSGLAPALMAESTVIADLQLVAMGEKDYTLKIRSDSAQAFDIVKNSDPFTVRLYNARIGNETQVPSFPQGTILLEEEPADTVLLKVSFTDTAYRATAGQGSSPNTVEIRIRWAPDITPPAISNISVAGLTSKTAEIKWTTDEPADGQVLYGENQPESLLSALFPALSTAHSVSLSSLKAGTLYYFRVRTRDAAGNQAESVSSLFTTPVPAFVESGGQVVLESENFDLKYPRMNKDWVSSTAQTGYSGSGYVISGPNTGANIKAGFVGTSPELVYRILFTKTGAYTVWIRGRCLSGNDDTIHAGIDGTGPASADRILYTSKSWGWSRKTVDGHFATLNVTTPGVHTFHVWMQEDGFELDKIVLKAVNIAEIPAGSGPSESPRTS